MASSDQLYQRLERAKEAEKPKISNTLAERLAVAKGQESRIQNVLPRPAQPTAAEMEAQDKQYTEQIAAARNAINPAKMFSVGVPQQTTQERAQQIVQSVQAQQAQAELWPRLQLAKQQEQAKEYAAIRASGTAKSYAEAKRNFAAVRAMDSIVNPNGGTRSYNQLAVQQGKENEAVAKARAEYEAWLTENDPLVAKNGEVSKKAAYDQAVVAKGKLSKDNPLNQDPAALLGGGGMGQAGAAAQKVQLLSHLTEDQKAYINYLYGAYDKKTADKLSETFLQDLENKQILTDESAGAKVQNAISAVGGNIAATPAYLADLVKQAVKNELYGTDMAVPEYSMGSRLMSENAARTQAYTDMAETDAGKFMLNTGASIGNNLVNTLLFGQYAPLLMAMQAGASNAYRAAENGATGAQQMGKAVTSGITEYLTERISWGRLDDILKGVGSKNGKALLAQVGTQMLTEAGEETVNEALGMLYDWIAMGEAGDLKKIFREHQSESGNGEASKQVALEILRRLGGAALGGAISGGILGGGAAFINQVRGGGDTDIQRQTETPEQTPAQMPAQMPAQTADLPKETEEAAGGDAAQARMEGAQGANAKVEGQKKVTETDAQETENPVLQSTANDKTAKRPAVSRAKDAGRELHAGTEGAQRITQAFEQMDSANMTPEMRRTVLRSVAGELVAETPFTDRSTWESFKPFRDYIRKTRLHIDKTTAGNIKSMGMSVSEFNKKYGTNLTTMQTLEDLDGDFKEWQPLTNGVAKEDETNAFDALMRTLEAMRETRAGIVDQESRNAEIERVTDVLQKYADEEPDAQELAEWTEKQREKTKTDEQEPETPSRKTVTSGWEDIKNNRIVDAMQRKPQGAVARIADAAGIRAVEQELAKAKELVRGLEETADKAEIAAAKAIAAGQMKIGDINTKNLNREMIERLTDEYRLINRLKESGLQGQKRKLHNREFARAENLLNDADDAIFEKDGEKGRLRRKVEAGRLMAKSSERVMRYIFGEGEVAQKAIDEYITPAEENEAAKVKAIGRLFDEARKLDLNEYESTMVQLVGEKIVPEWNEAGGNPLWKNGQGLLESLPEYARANPEIQKLVTHMGKIDHKKVMDAVRWYRKTYEDFFSVVNDFRLAHGMAEIGRTEEYFPHFSRDMDGDMLNKTLKAFGIEQMSTLPASVAGMTVGFRPNTRWVGNFQKRTGPQTVFDANMGFQMYANAVMDMLYHTDDIMRIRHLEAAIREQSSIIQEQGAKVVKEERKERLQKKLDDPEELERLEKQMEGTELAAKDLAAEYGGFVQWLREYGNKLANKGDSVRISEQIMGRSLTNKMNKLLSNYATAQIVGNIRSALANTTVLPKMTAMLGTAGGKQPEIYIGQAIMKMANGEMNGIYGRSEFLSGKTGVTPLSKEKFSDKAMMFFNVVEETMSNLAFASKYVQVQDQMRGSGKTAAEVEKEAIKQANAFAAQIMARRDKAGGSLLSRNRDPIIRLFNMFQTEISNEWQMFSQDIPSDIRKMAEKDGGKKAAAVYGMALARYLVYSKVLAFAAESILGINPFNDPLGWLVDFFKGIWEEPEEEGEKGKVNWQAAGDLMGEVAGALPHISIIAAMLGYTDDRLPLFNAKEFFEHAGSIFTAEKVGGKIEGAINTAGDLAQLAGVPGAGQGAKTAKGVIALIGGGKRSQKTGQLQDAWVFEDDWADIARALAFGPSAMGGVRKYYDTGKAELTLSQTDAFDAMVGAGIDRKQALEYVKWTKTVKAEQTATGGTVPNSKKRQYLKKINSMGSLTDNQRMIAFEGSIDRADRADFRAKVEKANDAGISYGDMLSWMEAYYGIYGEGKKRRAEAALSRYAKNNLQKAVLAELVNWER